MPTIGLNVRSVTRRCLSSAAVALALALYASVTIASWDGLEEHNMGTDPRVPNAAPAPPPDLENPAPDLCAAPQPGIDSDGDGMLDEDECGYFNTDPNNRDTDGDGSVDGAEDERKTNPNDPNDI